MSEKKQGTALQMRERMLRRYGDDNHHKHNKNHNDFRMHYRTHPVQITNGFDKWFDENPSTGLLREFKLKRMRKRANAGSFH